MKKKREREKERRREREKEGRGGRKRVVRESGRCVPAGSGVLIRWKEVVLLCWWMHEEAADRGSRRAVEFTPHLEQAPSCLIPVPLPFSYPPRLSLPLPLSRFSLGFIRHLFHLLLLVFFFFVVFARLVNASRPERTLHTQLFTSRLSLVHLSPAAPRIVKAFSLSFMVCERGCLLRTAERRYF